VNGAERKQQRLGLREHAARARAFAREDSQPAQLRLRRATRPAERPGHLATTAHIQAAYPFVAQAGLGARGVLIGRDVYGGPFAIDPWRMYEQGLVHDPNMLIVGRPGYGKSALVKTLLLRQRLFGRRVEVVDPKGEYDNLITALGGVVIRLEPGGATRLNPLERIGAPEQRQALLLAVTRAMLNRRLEQHEAVGLAAALTAADQRHQHREVCIPDIVGELKNPSEATAHELNVTCHAATQELRNCALALHRLCAGPLRGMFDAPTNTGEQTWEKPAIGLDVSALAGLALDPAALAIAMICATTFLDAKRHQRTREARDHGLEPDKTIRANDEGWRALPVPGLAEYYQQNFKLSRETGVQHIVVLHRFSDLSSAGETGSRAQQLAEGLSSETATRVVYRQAEQEEQLTARVVGLSSTEQRMIARELRQGEGLWRIEGRSFRVRHLTSSSEWPLIQTDGSMGERYPRAPRG
jgi:type IV secretory pathway VirB4 component